MIFLIGMAVGILFCAIGYEIYEYLFVDNSHPYDDLYNAIIGWQHEVFPNNTAIGAANHLLEEAQELVNKVDDPMEIADIFILLLAVSDRNNIDLLEAVYMKHKINLRRTFGPMDENGVRRHENHKPLTLA